MAEQLIVSVEDDDRWREVLEQAFSRLPASPSRRFQHFASREGLLSQLPSLQEATGRGVRIGFIFDSNIAGSSGAEIAEEVTNILGSGVVVFSYSGSRIGRHANGFGEQSFSKADHVAAEVVTALANRLDQIG